MNERFIKNAIVNPLLTEAYNNVEKVMAIYSCQREQQKFKKIYEMADTIRELYDVIRKME